MLDIVTIHNPDCGNVREYLAMIPQRGDEPHVVEYRTNAADRKMLCRSSSAWASHPRGAIAVEKGTPSMNWP